MFYFILTDFSVSCVSDTGRWCVKMAHFVGFFIVFLISLAQKTNWHAFGYNVYVSCYVAQFLNKQ